MATERRKGDYVEKRKKNKLKNVENRIEATFYVMRAKLKHLNRPFQCVFVQLVA
jgi:hypothetical protein